MTRLRFPALLLALSLPLSSALAQGGARLDDLTLAQARGGLEVAAEQRRLDDISRREAMLSADLTRRRGELSKLLGALALYRRQPPPALLVSPQRARDAVRGAILARALTPELTRRAEALKAELAQVSGLRRQAAAANAALFSAESEQAERAAQIAQAVREQTPPGRDGGLGPLNEGGEVGNLRLIWPAQGRVTQRFGDGLRGGGKALGLTIAAKSGDQVVSPAAGRVEFAGPAADWGIVLILKSGAAYHLVLGGLDQVTVQNGQSVAAGTPVGRMPKGARSSPELYLEVRENGAPADPARWMSGAPLGAPPQ